MPVTPAYGPRYSGARARNSATQSISHATLTAVTLDTEENDTDGYHSTSSNTSRMTVPVTGVYDIEGAIGYASSTGLVYAYLRVNAATFIAAVGRITSAATADLQIGAMSVSLAAGDYVELVAYHSTGGGSLNSVAQANYTPWLAIALRGV